jgi:hypothetical protein
VPWDREEYRQKVLEPARQAGNVPPPDLYVRYALSSGMASRPGAFTEQIIRVLAYWHELESKRTYARLAATLLAAHAELERAGPLTSERIAASNAHARQEQMRRLASLAAVEAGAASHVGHATVARLLRVLGGSVTETQVIAALEAAGVRVVANLPDLPAGPHPKHADVVQLVRLLGLRLSPEVIFGDAVRTGFCVLSGFRLADGRWIDDAAIAMARSDVDALPHSDPAKTPTENLLAILRRAARTPAELNGLLLSEVIEQLRPLAGSGFVQRAIAAQARELGLDEHEAGILAAAMLARAAPDTVRQQVQEELSAGRLREAQRQAADLPAKDSLRDLITARDAEVAALARRADQELAGGRREHAASLLAEAVAIARDDASLAERLAVLPPPPPRNAAAKPDSDHVLVTWERSPALAGRVRYRVVRGQGRAPASPAEGTTVVAQTDQMDTTDTEAPFGTDLLYSVFATRGSVTWSKPAITKPVTFAPDVADITVDATDTSVTMSWRVHPGADSVLVVRGEGQPPQGTDGGVAVEASLTGFTDTGLSTGLEYFYQIVASYRTPAGRRSQSAGIVVSAVPAPEPEAVTDLDVLLLDGASAIVAAWTPPQHGQVRLMLADKPAPWPAGTRITPEDAAGLREINGIPRPCADGRHAVEVSLPPGRHHILTLAARGRVVVVGNTAAIGLAEPVRHLAAARMHDVARLGWIWPDNATDAVVRWPGGQQRCSRRVYEDEGGVTLPIGPAETLIEVCALYSDAEGRITAPPARVSVPRRGAAVGYHVRRTGRLRPRQRIIELTAEQPARLPAMVIVRSTGRYAPDDPAEGQVVAHIEPQPIAPDKPVAITIEVPKGPAWLACFVDPATPAEHARDILLFPPPAEEMKVR